MATEDNNAELVSCTRGKAEQRLRDLELETASQTVGLRKQGSRCRAIDWLSGACSAAPCVLLAGTIVGGASLSWWTGREGA